MAMGTCVVVWRGNKRTGEITFLVLFVLTIWNLKTIPHREEEPWSQGVLGSLRAWPQSSWAWRWKDTV